MRVAVVVALLLTACSVQERQERKPAPVVDRDPAAVIARVRKVPGAGERLRPDSALVPATLGVKLDKPEKGDLEVILPLTARGPLRIARDAERVVDVTAEHAVDARGLVESGAMVFVAPSPDADAVMIAERARFTELRVLRGPATTMARWRLRLGEGLVGARLAGDSVELVSSSGAAWLRSEPFVAIDAAGEKHAVTPRLEGSGRSVTLTLEIEAKAVRFPATVVVAWSE
ncbi:MAG: hypothetical protein HYV09_18505 [Deltaproteobacteria bacterium]|nr:hypothetical protein [Deltaproteobacteria bacterium]